MQALIVGGGIAGPITAMALQQAGIDATIFEARPSADSEAGSYFTVTANGLDGLSAVGALDIATAAGFPTRRNVLWNHTGRRLATLPLDSGLPGSPAARTMKRSRLMRLVQEEAVRRGIKIEFGRRLIDATVTADSQVVASPPCSKVATTWLSAVTVASRAAGARTSRVRLGTRTLRQMPSIPGAFEAFERSRRERVEKIVAWGARGSSSKVPGAFGRIARDLMLRVVVRRLITEKSLAWMYDYRVDRDEPARRAAKMAA